MNVDELLAEAWSAVKKSGVPEALQPVAFKEAVDFLRSGNGHGTSPATPSRRRGVRKPPSSGKDVPDLIPDEAEFFKQLANESGLPEPDLRDILHLTADGKVQVTPPTKDLGTSAAEQAKTVVALVASARSKGLAEKPVNAEAVRREVERKHCYQANNFASKHLGPMKGFNAGSNKDEILVTSRWLEEFRAAVGKAHGRTAADDES